MFKRTLKIIAFTLACGILAYSVWKYEGAAIAAVAGAFALIAEVMGSI